MNVKNGKRGLQALALASLLVLALTAAGVTVAELQQRMTANEPLTVVDIRPTALFQKAHIPGAINVPASLLPEKNLPPLGRVVVCGEGLGRDSVENAVVVLNSKAGIKAEPLEGGFAAWESARAASTRMNGLQPEELVYITYDQLKTARMDDLILVDLRQARAAARQGQTAAAEANGSSALTDLRREFPGARTTTTPFSIPAVRQSANAGGETAPLLVLIDKGNGPAVDTARALQGGGFRRVVILAGGEQSLSRQGRPGLQRMGMGSIITEGVKKP